MATEERSVAPLAKDWSLMQGKQWTVRIVWDLTGRYGSWDNHGGLGDLINCPYIPNWEESVSVCIAETKSTMIPMSSSKEGCLYVQKWHDKIPLEVKAKEALKRPDI